MEVFAGSPSFTLGDMRFATLPNARGDEPAVVFDDQVIGWYDAGFHQPGNEVVVEVQGLEQLMNPVVAEC